MPKATKETLYQEAVSNVAMQSPQHLKEWLRASGRHYVVIKSEDLVDALPWPGGIEAFIQILEAYRQHRILIPAEVGPCPKLRVHQSGITCDLCRGKGEVMLRGKSDVLEAEERREAIQTLEAMG